MSSQVCVVPIAISDLDDSVISILLIRKLNQLIQVHI